MAKKVTLITFIISLFSGIALSEEIQEIVIGQRLGKFFNDFGEKYLKRFQSSTKIPIKISSDRRTAALGAAISFTCS